MARKISACTVLMIALLLWKSPGVKSAEIDHFNLDMPTIHIGAFYNGEHVTVSGNVPANSEAVVLVTGNTEDITLKKKGKLLGLIWMNLDSVTFRQTPEIYMLYTSARYEEMSKMHPNKPGFRDLGLDSLESRIQISAPSDIHHQLFEELVKLKKSEGVYSVDHEAVQYGAAQGAMKPFQVKLWIPPKLRPGQYKVEVIALNDGDTIARAHESLKIENTGLPAVLTNLAFGHGALYGILATLVAIFSGLAISLFIQKSSGAH